MGALQWNMLESLKTPLMSHAPISWLKAVALANIADISLTPYVSQPEMSRS